MLTLSHSDLILSRHLLFKNFVSLKVNCTSLCLLQRINLEILLIKLQCPGKKSFTAWKESFTEDMTSPVKLREWANLLLSCAVQTTWMLGFFLLFNFLSFFLLIFLLFFYILFCLVPFFLLLMLFFFWVSKLFHIHYSVTLILFFFFFTPTAPFPSQFLWECKWKLQTCR